MLAPMRGRAMSLADVPDPIFAAALVGAGAAIDPAHDGRASAVAPVDGTIARLHPHAFVVRTDSGAAVFVHLGIDTVQLGGEGFSLLVAENDRVGAGDPVVSWDPALVEANGLSAISPVIALDAAEATLSGLASGEVETGSPLFHWNR